MFLKTFKIGGVETTDPVLIEQEVHVFKKKSFKGQHRSCPYSRPPVDTVQPFQLDSSQLDEFTIVICELDHAQAARLEGDITLNKYLQVLESAVRVKFLV